MIGKIDLT